MRVPDARLTAGLLIRMANALGTVQHGREWTVNVITQDEDFARYLTDLGAVAFRGDNEPAGIADPAGAYWNDDGSLEWDLYLHLIEVHGPETVFEAAGGTPLTPLRNLSR